MDKIESSSSYASMRTSYRIHTARKPRSLNRALTRNQFRTSAISPCPTVNSSIDFSKQQAQKYQYEYLRASYNEKQALQLKLKQEIQ